MPTYQLPQANAGAAPQAAATPMLMSVATQQSVGVNPLTVGVPDTGPVHISALPLEVDLDLYAGDDFTLDIYPYNPDGSPMDCSSAAPMCMVRTTPQDDTTVAVLVVSVDQNLTGLLHVDFASIYTTNFPASCVFDVQLTIPKVLTLIYGTITMKPQVTR
jgi:hypothetical protein